MQCQFVKFFFFQKKEAQGDDASLPAEITSKLSTLTKEDCEKLTVVQIKKLRSLIDEAIVENNNSLLRHAQERDEVLKEISNWVHPSVPISNDEVFFVFNQ